MNALDGLVFCYRNCTVVCSVQSLLRNVNANSRDLEKGEDCVWFGNGSPLSFPRKYRIAQVGSQRESIVCKTRDVHERERNVLPIFANDNLGKESFSCRENLFGN